MTQNENAFRPRALLTSGAILLAILASVSCSGAGETSGDGDGDGDGTTGSDGGSTGVGGSVASGGSISTSGGASGVGGTTSATGGAQGTGGQAGTGGAGTDCTSTEAHADFSFFVTSWFHMQELADSPNGFGGDLRYNGALTGLEGADAICQEIASRVCFGHKTWKAFLSTSAVDAITRIGDGPWHDHAGNLVANDTSGLLSGDRPSGGCCDNGVFDELGVYHDGTTDVNNDNMDDDDHDVLTATNADGEYDGFSCDDWTSTTASDGGDGPRCGHAWPANSGQSWVEAHTVRGCAAGVNFVQDGPGSGDAVGAGGGYGALYCFAL